jgi:hypothetical protein
MKAIAVVPGKPDSIHLRAPAGGGARAAPGAGS